MEEKGKKMVREKIDLSDNKNATDIGTRKTLKNGLPVMNKFTLRFERGDIKSELIKLADKRSVSLNRLINEIFASFLDSTTSKNDKGQILDSTNTAPNDRGQNLPDGNFLLNQILHNQMVLIDNYDLIKQEVSFHNQLMASLFEFEGEVWNHFKEATTKHNGVDKYLIRNPIDIYNALSLAEHKKRQKLKNKKENAN